MLVITLSPRLVAILRNALIVAVLCAGHAAFEVADAQARRFEDETVVALMDDSLVSPSSKGVLSHDGAGGVAWVIRFPSGEQRNVIALRRSTATSAILLAGIRTVQSTYVNHGRRSKQVKVVTVNSADPGVVDAETRDLFARLQVAPRIEVHGLGLSSALAIILKSKDDPNKTKGKKEP